MAVESVRIEGLTGVMDALRALPAEVTSKRGGPVRRALRKAGVVIQDEAKRNVRRIIDESNKDDDNRSTGLLLLSLQTKLSRLRGGVNGEAYVVGVKRGQFYPDFRQGRKERVSAVQVGRLLEYGTEHRQPMPWLRPAFDAKKMQAVNTLAAELQAGIARAAKRAEKIAAAKANQP